MTVRDARPSDAGALLGIYTWYVRHTAVSFEYEPPTPEEFRQRMIRTTARYPWLVAEEAGGLLGYAYAGPFKGRAAYDWSCETTVYVAREARGRGVGRALYGALERALQSMGVRNLYACIAYPDPEDEYLTLTSPRFHARMGYAEAGRFRRCASKFGRWYDMVWMEKFIGGHEAEPMHVKAYDGAWAFESQLKSYSSACGFAVTVEGGQVPLRDIP